MSSSSGPCVDELSLCMDPKQICVVLIFDKLTISLWQSFWGAVELAFPRPTANIWANLENGLHKKVINMIRTYCMDCEK